MEEGDNPLTGVLKTFDTFAFVLTRLDGSYVPLSFCTKPTFRAALWPNSLTGPSGVLFEEFWNIQMPFL